MNILFNFAKKLMNSTLAYAASSDKYQPHFNLF